MRNASARSSAGRTKPGASPIIRNARSRRLGESPLPARREGLGGWYASEESLRGETHPPPAPPCVQGGGTALKRDRDRLELGIGLDSVAALLAAEARLLVAAERQGDVRPGRAIAP